MLRSRPPFGELQACAGEIVGLAGLAGAGSSEILESIFGTSPPASGSFHIDGSFARIRSPRDATRYGVALVPGDRKRDGLVLELDIATNLALPNLRLLGRFGFVLRSRGRTLCQSLIPRLRVKCTGPKQRTATLSGGNKQKLIGKWLAAPPAVLLLDEPTRGVDVGAKAEIHDVNPQVAAGGMAVVLSSSEMLELLDLCDRVLVLCEGRVKGELRGGQITEEAILQSWPRPAWNICLGAVMFIEAASLLNLLRQIAVPGIVASGIALVMIGGGFVPLGRRGGPALGGVLAVSMEPHGLWVALCVPNSSPVCANFEWSPCLPRGHSSAHCHAWRPLHGLRG